MYQYCRGWHYRSVGVVALGKTVVKLLFAGKIEIDLGLLIGVIAASIDASMWRVDLLRMHQWRLVLVYAGKLLASSPGDCLSDQTARRPSE